MKMANIDKYSLIPFAPSWPRHLKAEEEGI